MSDTRLQPRLSVGQAAPQFCTTDLFGNVIDLSGYAGQTVLLSFFRNSACALCNLQVHKLIEKHHDYHRRALAVIAVFESPRESLLEHVGKQDAPFPIIPDPQAQLYDLYGVEVSEAKVQTTMQSSFGKQRIKEAAEQGYALTPQPGSNFYRIPADFVIGPDGNLREVFYASIVGDHLSFEDIERHLSEIVPL